MTRYQIIDVETGEPYGKPFTSHLSAWREASCLNIMHCKNKYTVKEIRI